MLKALLSIPVKVQLSLMSKKLRRMPAEIFSQRRAVEKIPEFCQKQICDPIQVERAYGLYSAISYVFGASVSGAVYEFGSGNGWSSRVIAASMSDVGLRVPFFIFDSFMGFPKAESESDKSHPLVISGHWGQGVTWYGMTPVKLKRMIREFLNPSQIQIVDGWFKDTAIKATIPAALIHLDCDLYQSTFEVLDAMFKNKVPSVGAMIIFDDWHSGMCRNDLGQRRAWLEIESKYQVDSELVSNYGGSRRKIVVHSYEA